MRASKSPGEFWKDLAILKKKDEKDKGGKRQTDNEKQRRKETDRLRKKEKERKMEMFK